MNRFSIMAFLAITLTAATIGAHHSFVFNAESDALSDRKSYCAFARRHQNKNPVLSTYREFKMTYENFPEFLSLHLDDNESHFSSRLKQLRTSIQLLGEQKTNMSRMPASKVVDWKVNTEIPAQIEQLSQEAARLQIKVSDLHDRRFSEIELSNYYLEAREEALSSEPLPQYGLLLHFQKSFFGDILEVKPVWIETREHESWKTVAASRNPLLRLKRSMLTPELREAFQNKTLPEYFDAYHEKASELALSLKRIQWKYNSSHRLILLGSPSTHLAVQAVLDLQCLK